LLNIDDCRIAISNEDDIFKKNPHTVNTGENQIYGKHLGSLYEVPKGRWPSNCILDEEAGKMLDEQSGVSKSSNHTRHNTQSIFNNQNEKNTIGINDTGGASRFFYCAKASSRERNAGLEGLPLKEKKTLNDYQHNSEGRTAPKCGSPSANHHPCVKPLKLMEYLIKLVMPKGGILLDPFAGSGTTILAAQNLGFKAIGIEKEKEYCDIAEARLKAAGKQLKLDL
jgi:site-specific DNA-methyltransferase (adenine-specific)